MKLKTIELIKPHIESHDIRFSEDVAEVVITLTMAQKRAIVFSEFGVSTKNSRIINKKFKQVILAMIDECVAAITRNPNA